MSGLNFIMRQEDIEEEYLKCIGKIHPNDYFLSLNQKIKTCKLNIEPYEKEKQLLRLVKQSEPVKIGDRVFLLVQVCNPLPNKKKQKPSGLIFDDLSFLQVKEILLYDVSSKELFCYEYSYHYGIWDFENELETYRIRYDREVILRNPPKKNIEHLHVFYNDPHFNSPFINFSEIIDFICVNWDELENKFYIKELAI
ncbi:hypothetical protein [Paenibacillus polymyxa]|uniref:hypothetical protein n=1 Tax=Paenibacillus polymyxa TaxID=1406 RepID=UPI002ED472FA|nr:hypothetical protein [Paenibacillus polymyxa]